MAASKWILMREEKELIYISPELTGTLRSIPKSSLYMCLR